MLDGIDFDRLHGVWVSDTKFKGSYGRIAYRQNSDQYWVRWNRHGGARGTGESASCEYTTDLRMLAVTPDPWYGQCMACGEFALPLEVRERRAKENNP